MFQQINFLTLLAGDFWLNVIQVMSKPLQRMSISVLHTFLNKTSEIPVMAWNLSPKESN